MPTIALVVEQGFGARILLQSEVLDTLLAGGAEVVVLTSDRPGVEAYLRGRGLDQVRVARLDAEAYEAPAHQRLRRQPRRIRSFAVDTVTVDGEFEMQWKDARRRGDLLETALLAAGWLVARAMRASGLVSKAVVGLENRLDAPHVHDAFFEKYRPDAVVLTSIGTFDHDHYIIREATRHGARVVSYVMSWDNTTVGGLGVNLSDRVIVWSAVMKRELTELHRLPPESISVDGVPHYDFYVNGKADLETKADLARRFGFDPDKRILFLGTKSPNTFLYNADIARLICEAITDGRLPADCHLIVRPHPIYYRRLNGRSLFENGLLEWDNLLAEYGRSCLGIDSPEMLGGGLNMFMSDQEIPRLASVLRNSAVVVNMFSTLNVEASIFDTPIVNVAFDFTHKRPPGDKVARFNIHYDEVQTHNQRIVNSEGTLLAHSAEELIEQINRYLRNPALHAKGRRRIVETECAANLGHAGEVVARTILDTVAPQG